MKRIEALFITHEGIGNSIFRSQVMEHCESMSGYVYDFDILTYNTFKKTWRTSLSNYKNYESSFKTKMILKNRGFLTRVTVDQKVISYSFFYHNEYTCMYLSSVGLREYYKIVRNVHHKWCWTFFTVKHNGFRGTFSNGDGAFIVLWTFV